MKDSKEFLGTNDRLKTLDDEALNDELNKKSFDELIAHRDYMINQTLEDEQALSKEEIQEHMNRLLQMTREPSETEVKPIKIHTHKTAKRIAVLVAAILLLISILTLATVASKREFSIFNGKVTFEDGRIYVKFNQSEDDSLTMAELETDLREHGFEGVRLPGYFYNGLWMARKVNYSSRSQDQVSFELRTDDGEIITVSVFLNGETLKESRYIFEGAENAQTFSNGKESVYLIDHGDGWYELKHFSSRYCYYYISNISIEDIKLISDSILK